MKRRYVFLILFCLLYIASVMGFEDNFNDDNIGEWTIVDGTWGTFDTDNFGGTSSYYMRGYGFCPSADWLGEHPEIYQDIGALYQYYKFDIRVKHWGPTYYYLHEYGIMNYYWQYPNYGIATHQSGTAGYRHIEGIGFTMTTVTVSQDTWYRIYIVTTTDQIRIRIYDEAGTEISDQTVAYTPPDPVDGARMSLKGRARFHSGTGYIYAYVDNIYGWNEWPGIGSLDIPSFVVENEIADLTYAFSESDFDAYDYYIYVYTPSGSLTSYTIISATPEVFEYSTVGRSEGIYAVYLIGKSKSTGVEYALDYAEMEIDSTVEAYGQTIDATSWINISGVNVTYFQSPYWHNDTSDASGFYNVSNMSVGYLIDINASKTNYTHEAFNVTPTFSYNNSVDLYLFPTNRTLAGTSIVEGVTVSYPWHQGIGGAMVNLYNDTWSNTTTSNANGYYQFNLSELVNGTYTVNATLSGYDDSSEYTITVTENQSTVQNIVLNKKYVLTVTATDATTSSPLSTFSTTVDGTLTNTDNGTTTHYLDYGLYLVTAGAEGYMASSEYALMIMDRSIEFSLSREDSQNDYHLDYAHYVKFILTSLNGTRYSDVTVTVSDGQTGITDDEGGVGFEMSQNTSYTLTFVNLSQGILFSRTLYPVESLYYVYLEESVGFSTGNVSANLTDFNITYFNDSFSLQNITGSYLTSTMGFNAMSQGIIAGFVIWIVIGAGGPFTAVAAGVVMAIQGVLSWVVVLFITMTIIAIWILEGHIG